MSKIYNELIKALKKEENSKFTLLEIHGRPIFVRETRNYEEFQICADCGCKAHMKVYEVGGVSPSNWYFCGTCNIG